MSKKIILISIAVIGVVGLIFVGPKISVFLAGRTSTVNENSQEFLFDAKQGLNGLATKLFNEGIIKEKDDLLKVGEYKELNEERLASGKYIIEPGTNFRTLLNGFTKNSAGNGNAEVEVDVTFNNCRDVYQLAGKVSKLILADSASIVLAIESNELLTRTKLNDQTVPSLFLPNTYKMFYDTPAEEFVSRMEKQYVAFWNEDRMSKLRKVGFAHPSEAVTLASIVYSEQSKNADEWPIIAGLYLNRLNDGMKLQSDPTFKFCWGDELQGVQRLTYEHRERDCSYNTYIYKGLPPGPICIPPIEVVEAVLNPDKNSYLYMCAKPDYTGRHDFEVDYAAHKRNADKFSTWISKQ
jgi:UPF0755 protein